MSLPIEQQIKAALQDHSNILVCLPRDPSTDAIASGLAMYHLLQKMGKQAKVVADNFALPTNHQFLPKSDVIEKDLDSLSKFVISVDTASKDIEDINYTLENDRLNIFITPKQGNFETKDVSTSSSDYAFDLIVVIDSRDLESLGNIFSNNADFFHHSPIINLDHHPGNENFGQINFLDITATSISEIIFGLIQHIEINILDEFIATNLLAGIISKTKSFKTNTVTPKSLAIASHLIQSGARREDIVKNLYQTKTIEALQLWGRALAKLEADTDNKIVWSMLHSNDFIETHTTPLDLEQVIDELIINTPDAENIYVIYEQTDVNDKKQTYAIIYTAPYINALKAFQDWQAEGSRNFTYLTLPNVPVEMAQAIIHEKLRSLIKQ